MALGIEEKPIAPRAPGQNPCGERLIGIIRRECLDGVIILGARQLRTVLQDYCDHYHLSRPHRLLAQDSPVSRRMMTLEHGTVVEFPQVGGLKRIRPAIGV